jgi:6-pyruvoyltetrahydropterin/6-carboxytetrahydropterin synthase
MLITKRFQFDSAHYLTDYYGKCENMHGHTYTLEITLEGDVLNNGLVLDFVIFKRIIQKRILEKLDHQLLNDIVDNPSVEKLSIWIWDQLEDFTSLVLAESDDPNLKSSLKSLSGIKLYEVKLWESPNAWVIYRGH